MFKRLSDHFASAKDKDPAVKACGSCHGTGDTGGRTEKGETIACPDCNGWGY